MKNIRKVLALVLALCLLLAAAGCAKKEEEKTTVNIGVLKGPTGIGAAYLIHDDEEGTTANDYEFSMATAPDEMASALISGTLDIAAVPTNVAVSLYNKTEGGVKLLALNTLGVLHILENGESVHSMADLAGKTLYATGQGANPEYVLCLLYTSDAADE